MPSVRPRVLVASIVASLMAPATAAAQAAPPAPDGTAQPEPPKAEPKAEPPKAEPPKAEPVAKPPADAAPAGPYQLQRPTVGAPSGKFEFGSYGRVLIASDARGRTGRNTNVVSFGPRVDEDSYAELELRREDTVSKEIQTRVVGTLAIFPPFFHSSGKPTANLAVRNLYAQAQVQNYTLWVGSRMYRGDDIYLLNWWPLDNQNTVGGGAGVKLPPATGDTTIAAHVGMQRLDNPYQFQQVPVTLPLNGLGATQVTTLDRPRIIETVKLTHLIRNTDTRKVFDSDSKMGFKVIVYAELHQIGGGVFRDGTTLQEKSLPSDTGWLVGTELAYWTGERDTFVQLYMRHARGLAAYDPLAAPISFDASRTTGGANDSLVAIGGNWESGPLAVLYGAYLKFFRDANPTPTSPQKFDEGAIVVRPHYFFDDHWGVALDASFQARRLAVLDPSTDEPLSASVFKAGVIPFFSPTGRGSYKRPQLRLLYVVTARNSGARALYAAEDPFATRKVEHYLGLGAEWWFNSSSYP